MLYGAGQTGMDEKRSVCAHCGFEVVQDRDVCPLCGDSEATGTA